MSKLTVNQIEPNTKPGIGIGGVNEEICAILNLQSTSKGFMPPRMTTAQRDAILSPQQGLLIWNTDTLRLEEYNGTAWSGSGAGASRVKNVLRVVKNSPLDGGDFSSVNDALDSISDNSISNPYLIYVGPGVFVEDTIQMKPYVFIMGSGEDITVIEVDDASKHVIRGSDYSMISYCLLTGATDSGKAAIHHDSLGGTTNTAFLVENCRFGLNHTQVLVESTLGVSAVFVTNCKFGDGYSFQRGFVAKDGTNAARIVIRNSTTTSLATPLPTVIFQADGPNAEIIINAVQSRNGGSVSGTCINILNGGKARVLDISIKGFAKAIWMESSGSAPIIRGQAIVAEDCTVDIQIDHASAVGTISGLFDRTKVFSISTSVGMSYLDTVDGSTIVTGHLYQGFSPTSLADISTLIIESSTMGVMEGGELEDDGGLNLMIREGFGYLEIEPEIIKQYSWSDTSFAIPANQTSYIYIDSTGAFVADTTHPTSHLIILLGRVRTNGSSIVFIDESTLVAEHSSNLFDHLIREYLGCLYGVGSVVSENGTRQLDVTPGLRALSTVELATAGGTAISWDAYRGDGSGGHTVVSQSVVDNAFWDDGSGILAALTAGYYAKHSLYIVGQSGPTEKYMLVYSQVQYSDLTLAEQGDIPTPPEYFTEGVTLIRSIIVQQGVTNIVQLRDERPRIGFSASGVAAATYHSNLLGLDIDDHLQYLNRSGVRAMLGALDMGGFAITNVGNVDGVDVSDHDARHSVGGADALATGTPSDITDSTNSVGAGPGYSPFNHLHAHGSRGGGSLHALATAIAHGFMSSTDKSKLDGISGTRIIKSGTVAGGSFTGSPKKFTVTFGIAFPSTAYAITFGGENARSFTYESKGTGSFVISANAAAVLSGEVSWTAIQTGESVE